MDDDRRTGPPDRRAKPPSTADIAEAYAEGRKAGWAEALSEMARRAELGDFDAGHGICYTAGELKEEGPP